MACRRLPYYHRFLHRENFSSPLKVVYRRPLKEEKGCWDKYQWDLIHNPQTVLFSWLEEEGEGEIVSTDITNKEFYRSYKIRIDYLNVQPFFKKVYNSLQEHSSVFLVQQMSAEEQKAIDDEYKNTGLTELGNYQGGIGLLFDNDTCFIKLYPIKDAFTTYVVFHELFHAAQDIYYNLSNLGRDEVEVRIAALFLAYQSLGDGFRNLPDYVFERLKTFQIDDELIKYLVRIEDNQKVFNSTLKEYFDLLIEQKTIPEGLKEKVISNVTNPLQSYLLNEIGYKFPIWYNGELKFFENLIYEK